MMKKIYLDYDKKSFKDIINAIMKLEENEKNVSFKISFEDKANLTYVYNYLKKNKFTKITFVINEKNYSNSLIKLIKDKKTPLTVQFLVEQELGNKEKCFFEKVTKIQRNYEVYDFSNLSLGFFDKFKNISCFKNLDEKIKHKMLYIYCNNGLSYCKASSCLGKVLYIKKDGNVSFCPKYSDMTYLKNIKEVKSYDELFDDEKFVEYLEKMIQKREVCKKECLHFSKCKGGCPISDTCQSFKENILLAEKVIKDVLSKNTNLNEVPMSVKENILWLLCANK